MSLFVLTTLATVARTCYLHGSWEDGARQGGVPLDATRHLLLLTFPPDVDDSPYESVSLAEKFSLEARIGEEACAYVSGEGGVGNETACTIVAMDRQLNSEADDAAEASCIDGLLTSGALAGVTIDAVVAGRFTSFVGELVAEQLSVPLLAVDLAGGSIGCSLGVAANSLGLQHAAVLNANADATEQVDSFVAQFDGDILDVVSVPVDSFLTGTVVAAAALLDVLVDLTVAKGARTIVFFCFSRGQPACSRIYEAMEALPPRVRENLVLLGSDGLWDQRAEAFGGLTPQGTIAVDEGGVEPTSTDWAFLRWKLADVRDSLVATDLGSASALFVLTRLAASGESWNQRGIGQVAQFAGGAMEHIATVEMFKTIGADGCGEVASRRTTLPIPLPTMGRSAVQMKLQAPPGAAEDAAAAWLGEACARVDDSPCCSVGCTIAEDGVDPGTLVSPARLAALLAEAGESFRRRLGLLDLPTHIAVAKDDEAATAVADELRVLLPHATASPADAVVGFMIASTPGSASLLSLALRADGAFGRRSNWIATPSLALTPASRTNAGLVALEPWPGLRSRLETAVNRTVEGEEELTTVWADEDGVWRRRPLDEVPPIGVDEESRGWLSIVVAGPTETLARIDAREVCVGTTKASCAVRSGDADDTMVGQATGDPVIYVHWYDDVNGSIAVVAGRRAEADRLVASRLGDDEREDVEVRLCPLGLEQCDDGVLATTVHVVALIDEEAESSGDVVDIAAAVQARLDDEPFGFEVHQRSDGSFVGNWSSEEGWSVPGRPTTVSMLSFGLSIAATAVLAAVIAAVATFMFAKRERKGRGRAGSSYGVEMSSGSRGRLLRGADLRLHATPIGSGHFGLVQKGVVAQTGTQVAVKQLKHVSDTGSTDYRRACDGFLTELQILAFLPPHPNVVQLVGWTQGEALADVWIVLRLCNNASVDRWLVAQTQNGREVSWLRRLDLLLGVVEGLAAVHRSLVVHRDLALRNVLLDVDQEDGTLTPKLTDFGMARTIIAVTDVFPGTDGFGAVRWMAPEALAADRSFGAPCDMWAVGVVVYELATDCAHDPYRSSFDSAAVRDGTLTLSFPPDDEAVLPEEEGDARSSLQTVFATCLEHDWRARPTAQAVVARVKPTVKRVARSRTRAADHPSSAARSAAQPGTSHHSGRSRRSSTSERAGSRHSRHQYHLPQVLDE
jgi:serine/threonine protein kinase